MNRAQTLDNSLFEKLILKTVYNLKFPSEYSTYFSPIKKKIQLNFKTFSTEEKKKIEALLEDNSKLSLWIQKITSTKLTSEGKEKNNLTISIEVIDNISENKDSSTFSNGEQKNIILRLENENMDYLLSFYHSIINSAELKLESISEEILREFYLKLISAKKDSTKELGKKLLKDFLEYREDEINPELAYLVGKTRYSFSYNQNLLEHLLEVSTLSANFAYQLGLDVLKAKRAAFFHDVGKVAGHRSDHVLEGIKMGQENKLDEYILETIEKHHYYEHSNESVYLTIVRAMDKLSAGRLGARPWQLEKTKERNEKLLSLLLEIDGIARLEFRGGGHIIKIFLEPRLFQWEKLENLKREIAKKIKDANLKYQYNYQFLLSMEYSDSFLLDDFL